MSVEEDTTTRKERPELDSSQEETDTRVVLYARNAADMGYKVAHIKSPDSDIFFILLYHSSYLNIEVLFESGTGNRKRLLNISKLNKKLGHRVCSSLLSLHALTGCDTTSSLKGIGKIKLLKILEKYPMFHETLEKIGENWIIDEDTYLQIEMFICCLYGYPKTSQINDVRLLLLKKKCVENDKLDSSKNIDLGALPPCRGSLKQHVMRTNYQVAVWKHANENYPEIPDCTLHGWKKEGDFVEPVWTEEDVLPKKLIDLMNEDEFSDNESDIEMDNSDSTTDESESEIE